MSGAAMSGQVKSGQVKSGRSKGMARRAPVASGVRSLASMAAEEQAQVLISLFRDAGPHRCAHWNIVSQEVFSLRGRQGAESALEAFEQRLFEEDGWVEVPWVESDEAHGIAEAFVEEFDDPKLAARLGQALAGPKPFRAFRAVLATNPAVADLWREREDEAAAWRLAELCVAWDVAPPTAALQAMVETLRAQDDGADDGDARSAHDAREFGALGQRVPVTSLTLAGRRGGGVSG